MITERKGALEKGEKTLEKAGSAGHTTPCWISRTWSDMQFTLRAKHSDQSKALVCGYAASPKTRQDKFAAHHINI